MKAKGELLLLLSSAILNHIRKQDSHLASVNDALVVWRVGEDSCHSAVCPASCAAHARQGGP